MKKQFVKSKDAWKVTFNPALDCVGEANDVKVLGDFNNWNPEEALELKKQKDGSFKGSLDLDNQGEYHFKYFIDNTRWATEPAADENITNQFGETNSVIRTTK